MRPNDCERISGDSDNGRRLITISNQCPKGDTLSAADPNTSIPQSAWKVAPEYSAWRYVTETWRDIKVFRAPLWVPFHPSGRKRVLHLLSFAVTTLPLLVRSWFWKPDLVWVAAPAFVCTPAALVTAAVCGAKSWIHVQDFEVDIAFGMRIISGNKAYRMITACENWLFSRFSRVSTISKPMIARALAKGVARDKTLLIPNWVDLKGIAPSTAISPYRAELGIPNDATVALYSGSMGVKQAVDWLATVAVRMSGIPNLYFVFCGDGPLRAQVEEACAHLPSVLMLPLQPIERLGELLGLADIHMLPQRPGAAEMVMPSKLTGMLASGRPVAVMAEPESELADVVGSCGRVTAPGDLDAFVESIQDLHDQPRLRAELGRAGRAYARSNLSAGVVLARLEAEMQWLADGASGVKDFQ